MKTRIDIPSNSRTAAAEVLNARLADTIDLALSIKQAHWNIRGKSFIGVHEMLDTLRGELDAEIDTVAERVAQLGQTALGTLQVAAKATALEAYPTKGHAISDHLEALASRYGSVGNQARKDIATLEELDDPASADILTAMSRVLDKGLWFIEAHLTE